MGEARRAHLAGPPAKGPVLAAPFSDFASLTEAEREGLGGLVAGHEGLDQVLARGRSQSPAIHPVDAIRQDELTHALPEGDVVEGHAACVFRPRPDLPPAGDGRIEGEELGCDEVRQWTP